MAINLPKGTPGVEANRVETRRSLQNLWALTQFGWQVALCILVGLAIDRNWNTTPWGTLICSMIGLVTAITLLIRTALDSLHRSTGKSKETSP